MIMYNDNNENDSQYRYSECDTAFRHPAYKTPRNLDLFLYYITKF